MERAPGFFVPFSDPDKHYPGSGVVSEGGCQHSAHKGCGVRSRWPEAISRPPCLHHIRMAAESSRKRPRWKSGAEGRAEKILHGVPVAFGSGLVVGLVVGDSKTMSGLISLDRVGYTGRGQGLFQKLLVLVGE
jgi:hypothetical protein